jgi:hypothetical protein
MWGPPPRPDLRKYFRRVTLHQITDNYEPNGKSYTIGKLRLYAPTIGITAQGASGGLWFITSQRHSQTDGDATVGVSMPPGPLPGHYMGVLDLWSDLRT